CPVPAAAGSASRCPSAYEQKTAVPAENCPLLPPPVPDRIEYDPEPRRRSGRSAPSPHPAATLRPRRGHQTGVRSDIARSHSIHLPDNRSLLSPEYLLRGRQTPARRRNERRTHGGH